MRGFNLSKLQDLTSCDLYRVGVLVVFLIFFSVSSWADPTAGRPGPAPSGNASWADPSNPMCRQGCTYDKANETISIQLQYAENKLQAAKDKLNQSDWSGVLELLGDFCLSSERGGGESEAVACFDRYERYEVLALQKMRSSLIRNEDSHAKYLSQQKAVNGGAIRGEALPNIQHAMRENETPRRPIVSHLPSFQELQELDRREGRQMRASITNQFSQWLADYPRTPDRADFVLTRRVLRDPGNPASGYFTVIDTNPDGTPKYDEQAYRNATAVYRREIANIQADAQGYRGEAVQRDRELRQARTRLGAGQVDAESRTAFNDARGVFVDAANRSIQGQQQRQARPAPARPGQRLAPRASDAPPAANTSSTHLTGNGAVPGVTARTPAARPTYTGNEQVAQPPPTLQNQFNTNSVTIDTGALRQNFNTLLDQINDVDIPALSDP